MTHLRSAATFRDKAATACGLLAMFCWLVVSLVPPALADSDRDPHHCEVTVASSDHGLGTEGLRPESISAKSTLDTGKHHLVAWVSTDALQAVAGLHRLTLLPALSTSPAISLLTLGIGLRL